MSAPTMGTRRSRGKVGKYVPHVSRMATVLATATRSAVANQRQIEATRALLSEMAVATGGCPLLREWFRGYLAPFVAVVASDSAAEQLRDLLDAKAAADASEDLRLQRCAAEPTPDNKRKLASALRLEMARSQDVLAALEVQ